MSFTLAEPTVVDSPVNVEWEETACLLCRGRNWFTLVEAPDRAPGCRGLWFAVVQCNDCGLCFTNPRPDVESLAQFYPPSYAPHQLRDQAESKPRFSLSSLFHRGTELATPDSGGRRLLDFGCGAGSFLARMHGQGWEVTGIDASPLAVETVRSRLGLRALAGSLPHPDLKDERFDLITMRQSLEHVGDPQEVLNQAYGLLKPRGRMIVSVPNIDSLPFRWFGHAWFGLDLPRHLTHFAPWTLQFMLERAGFRVGPIRTVRRGKWFQSSARLASRIAPGNHFHRFLAVRPAASLLAWYSYLTNQCDCMTVVAERPDSRHSHHTTEA
jgi:2-polyprenyl-3-methyl-5-hydroxy-6-metoxy-1,4-benzoquinol methylase